MIILNMMSNDIDKKIQHEHDLFLKILFVGEPNVGKTSIVKRYAYGNYMNGYKATIGADFATKIIQFIDKDCKYNITLQLWDLAGQERFSTQIKYYFRDAKGFVCVCDITNKRSIDNIFKWKKLVEEHFDDDNIPPCILMCNKLDMTDKSFVITDVLSELLITEFKYFFPVSAVKNIQIDDAMMKLIHLINEKYDLKALSENPEKNIELDSKIDIVQSSTCC